MSSLRAAGLRVTTQRCAILQVLEASDHPLSVEEIHQRLEQHGSGIPTIYRNLQCFVKLGWAEPILGLDQIMRFVRCRSGCHHHHLQCEACGRTVEVANCGAEDILANLQCPSGFKVTRHHLQLFGLCPECQK
jgi:Fe2+ or Zn2+ uptake regulation protein